MNNDRQKTCVQLVAELDALREQHRALLNHVSDAIITTDLDDVIQSWTAGAEGLYGWSIEEAVGRQLGELIPTDYPDPQQHQDILAELQTKDAWSGEVTQTRKDGGSVAVHARFILVKDAGGHPAGMAAICRTMLDPSQAAEATRKTALDTTDSVLDVTARKEQEEKLRAAQTQLRTMNTMVEQSPVATAMTSSDGHYVYVNPAFLKLFGFSKEIVSELFSKYSIREDEQIRKMGLMPAIERAFAGESVVVPEAEYDPIETLQSLDFDRIEGRKRWLQTRIFPLLDDSGQTRNIVFLYEDITDRKRAEDDLRESKQLIEGILNALPARVFWKDKELVYLGCNTLFARDAGFADPGDVVGKDDYMMAWREQAELYRGDDRQVIDSGLSKHLIEEPQTTPEGKVMTLLTSKMPLRNTEGEVCGVLGTYLDITDHKNAELALRENQTIYRVLVETSPDAITYGDIQGRIISANRQAAIVHGFDTVDEMLGVDAMNLIAPDERQRAAEFLARLASDEMMKNVQITLRKKDGTLFSAEMSAVLVRDVAGVPIGVMVITRDLTERNRLQAQIAQGDRLSSMGMLAAGVAHEINNPLSYVLYNLESLTDDLPKLLGAMRDANTRLESRIGHEVFEEAVGDAGALLNPAMLNDIQDRFRDALSGTQRIREVSRGLGTFSRVEQDQKMPIKLMHVIEVAINMAFNEIKYRARLVKDYGKIPTVMASEGRLSQVFLNLIINATHAIEDGDVEGNEIRVRTWAEGADVCAEVRDTGNGITPQNLSRLFDPFFTTKEVGVGSGLGLSISKNIIEGYGGSITAESTVGKGTSFFIRIPTGTEAADALAVPFAKTDDPQIGGRILLVDDEDGIRSAMARMLTGHDTVEASSGSAAKVILENDDNFDLVLCDMMMPDISGMDLHEWLATEHPRLAQNFIFITGGAFTPRAREYLKKIDNLRIEKPFDTANFKKIVANSIWRVKSEAAS